LELFPELKPLLKRNAGSLSGGEQQILCLARCLSRHPKVILVDEISLGLAPMVTARVLSALVDVAQSVGVGVVLVEQHVYAAFEASQRAYVLQRGRIVLEGKSMDLIDRIDEIQEVYIAPSDRPNP
jgi:branched-chain amino acid transport system ATP-binding protein